MEERRGAEKTGGASEGAATGVGQRERKGARGEGKSLSVMVLEIHLKAKSTLSLYP